jgi:antitoxin MazE
MQTTIQKWGNSQAVRLPKTILEPLLLKDNDLVEIKTINDSIVITKATRKRRAKKSLNERFMNWNGAYEVNEEDMLWLNTKPAGREVRL